MGLNIAIVGSREYDDMNAVYDYVAALSEENEDHVIVSGGARGVDTTAQQAAEDHGMGFMLFPADWKTYGKGAGMKRNRDIVLTADRVVAFWDGESKGTKNTIDLALLLRRDLEVRF